MGPHKTQNRCVIKYPPRLDQTAEERKLMENGANHRTRVGAKRRQEMHDKLLMSGVSLAAEKSVHNIRIDEVIEHARVSRGTFYNYFRSVQELFAALASQIADEFTAGMDLWGQSIPDPALRVSVLTRAAMRTFASTPRLGHLILQIEWPTPKDKKDPFQSIENDVQSGIDQGRFESMPIAIGTSLIVSGLKGGVHAMLMSPPAIGYEDQAVYHILLGLGVEASEAKVLSSTPLPPLPEMPPDGILAKITNSSM